MKYQIDGVIVVEGKSDVCYLSSFINALFFTTNGLDISQEKIDFLNKATQVNKVIILTDDDEAGENIREQIKTAIPGVFEAKIASNSRKFLKKKGVAESSKESVINALKPYFIDKEIIYPNFNLTSLISLSNNPTKSKQYLIDKCGLIYGNNKSLENQLRILKKDPEEIWKLIAQIS